MRGNFNEQKREPVLDELHELDADGAPQWWASRKQAARRPGNLP